MDFSEGAPIPPGRNSNAWVGQVIADKYRVLDVLGRGGFGSVYLGEITAEMVGECLALKVLPEKFSDNHTVREQFLNEIRVSMKMIDKYIVQIRDVGTTATQIFTFVTPRRSSIEPETTSSP